MRLSSLRPLQGRRSDAVTTLEKLFSTGYFAPILHNA